MNAVLLSIVLIAVDTGKVNDSNDLGISVFQFIDRDVAVRKLATSLDGSNCFSVSVVVEGNLIPSARLWIDSGRNLGMVAPDLIPEELAKWFTQAEMVMKGDGDENVE